MSLTLSDKTASSCGVATYSEPSQTPEMKLFRK